VNVGAAIFVVCEVEVGPETFFCVKFPSSCLEDPMPAVYISLCQCVKRLLCSVGGCPAKRLTLSINALSACFCWVVGNGDGSSHPLASAE